jgi:hypothetical protein
MVSRIYTFYKSLYCSTHKVFRLHQSLPGNDSKQWRFFSFHTYVVTSWWLSHNQLMTATAWTCNSWQLSPDCLHTAYPWLSTIDSNSLRLQVYHRVSLQLPALSHWFSLYSLGAHSIENTTSNSSSTVTCISVVTVCVYWAITYQRKISSGSIIPAFQLPCHN